MPALQLITAALERGINTLLRLDESSYQRLQPLSAKQLKISIREFPQPLVLCFSDRIDLLIDKDNSQVVDCSIALSLSTLGKLKDSSQISSLIQQQRLVLEGDIHIAQHFSNLLGQLQIDWEEQLSRYTGDVLAHQIHQGAGKLADKLRQGLKQATSVLSDYALEERPIAAHPVAIAHFTDQVEVLGAETEQLAERLALLESKR